MIAWKALLKPYNFILNMTFALVAQGTQTLSNSLSVKFQHWIADHPLRIQI